MEIDPNWNKLNFSIDILMRFWEKVDVPSDFENPSKNKCWNWKAATAGKNYGVFYWNGKQGYSHRFVYECTQGIIPIGMYVCHKCDNPLCCNPTHLFLGTSLDNNQDMIRKGRARRAVGSEYSSSKLTDQDVIDILQNIDTGIFTNISQIEKRYPIKRMIICNILYGKNWKHITNKYYPGNKLINLKNKILLDPAIKAATLTEYEVRQIKISLKNGESPTQIAKSYPNVNRSAIYAIKHGKSWNNITI